MNENLSATNLQSITDAISKHPNPTITGATLGMLVRQAAPDLDLRAAANHPVGTGALAKFVDLFLPHLLKKVGQTSLDGINGDNVYRRLQSNSDHQLIGQATGDMPDHDFWNAFVRTTDPRTLQAENSDGAYQLTFDANNADKAIQIDKVTPEELDQISRDFIALLDAKPETAETASLLRTAASYSNFVEILKTAGSAFFIRWSEHRRESLRRLFLKRLEANGVPLAEQQKLLGTLNSSQESARNAQKTMSLARSAASQSRFFVEKSRLVDSLTPQSRDLLLAVISRMSTQEIRAISLPFGHVLDAFESLTQKG